MVRVIDLLWIVLSSEIIFSADSYVKEYKDESENTSTHLYVSSLTLVFCLLLNGLLVFYIICLRRKMQQSLKIELYKQSGNSDDITQGARVNDFAMSEQQNVYNELPTVSDADHLEQ